MFEKKIIIVIFTRENFTISSIIPSDSSRWFAVEYILLIDYILLIQLSQLVFNNMKRLKRLN